MVLVYFLPQINKYSPSYLYISCILLNPLCQKIKVDYILMFCTVLTPYCYIDKTEKDWKVSPIGFCTICEGDIVPLLIIYINANLMKTRLYVPGFPCGGFGGR